LVKQQKLTRNVVICDEAGAFGFQLHRRFEELDIKNYVMQPQDWDERGKGGKNDQLDEAVLCQRLDRYERGNKKAFSTVPIPTVYEERQRQQLMCERERVAGMGRVLLALHDIHVTGKWWKDKADRPFWVLMYVARGNRHPISHLCSKTLRCLHTISSVWS
jgi:hypothetical protein